MFWDLDIGFRGEAKGFVGLWALGVGSKTKSVQGLGNLAMV